MAASQLPKNCAIDGLAQGLSEAGGLSDQWTSTVLFIPDHGRIHCSALTFLCAWGRQQRRRGREILIRSDESVLKLLARLQLHEHLGLEFRKDSASPADNPVVPLRLISDEHDTIPAATEIGRLVEQHFDNAASFLPALRWAVNEILDNVLRHADATDPGAVYCEYFPREHRLDVAICDVGRGIFASLGATTYLYSHGHAITQAVRRGVTRSTDIGQGNGLAGVVEIVKQNGGDLQIWTGNAVYRVINGDIKGFAQIPLLPGTGVAFSLNTRNPVDLRDTWIASSGAAFLSWPTSATPARPVGSQSDEGSMVKVFEECASTAMRGPAQRLRERILPMLLFSSATPLTLDFSSVDDASSSFLDELLGRLAAELGAQQFHHKINITGMSDLIQRMSNVVIQQRLEDQSRPGSQSEGQEA